MNKTLKNKKIRIAINGFGRIGRIFFRQAIKNPSFEIIAINDLGNKDNLLYLLKYDSVYGQFEVNVDEIKFLQESDPYKLPWKEMDIDIVVESTGVFTSYEKASAHINAGAKRVVITAPAKDDGQTKTATPNIGIEFLNEGNISSNASCTTNAVTPIAQIMIEYIGIEKAILNTIHGYTSTQSIVDSPNKKDFRKGRSAAQNIIPSTTGAAIATSKAIPALKDIFDGISMRVPVVTGSIADFTFIAKKNTTKEEINDIFKKEARSDKWRGILTTTDEPIVSSDIIGSSYGSIVDLSMTRVVGGNLIKVLSWYDNEWGYCSMLIKHIESLRNLL